MYHKKDVEKNIWFINTFNEKCGLYNIQMELVTVEHFLQMYHETGCLLPDAVVARMIHPAVSKLLEDEGVRVYNSFRVSNICNNKAECMRFINSLGIQHIPTLAISCINGRYVFEQICSDGGERNLKELIENCFAETCPEDDTKPHPSAHICEKFVIKSVSGHGGREVMLLSEYFDKYGCSLDDFKLAPASQEQAAADYFSDKYVVQPLVECDGRDLRIYIIGGNIIGAVIRKANGGFKSNFSLGGTVEQYTLNSGQKSIVNKITDAMDIDYGGLDFLVCGENDELIFNEIEDVVGARMLSECSDIDYIECYVKYIHSCFMNM